MPHRHIKYHKWKIGLIILLPESVLALISILLVQHSTWSSATNLGAVLFIQFFFTYHIQYIISLIYSIT